MLHLNYYLARLAFIFVCLFLQVSICYQLCPLLLSLKSELRHSRMFFFGGENGTNYAQFMKMRSITSHESYLQTH